MRVYIPATFDLLHQLAEQGELEPAGGWVFGVTAELQQQLGTVNEEELEHWAFLDAAEASLRLLAKGATHYPHRRVVISADVPGATDAPEQGDSTMQLTAPVVKFADIACFHVDLARAEETTAQAVAVIDQADLGDEDAVHQVANCLDVYLAYYDPSEIGLLTAL